MAFRPRSETGCASDVLPFTKKSVIRAPRLRKLARALNRDIGVVGTGCNDGRKPEPMERHRCESDRPSRVVRPLDIAGRDKQGPGDHVVVVSPAPMRHKATRQRVRDEDLWVLIRHDSLVQTGHPVVEAWSIPVFLDHTLVAKRGFPVGMPMRGPRVAQPGQQKNGKRLNRLCDFSHPAVHTVRILCRQARSSFL